MIELGNTDVIRDFGDVRDVARAYVAIVNAAPAGKTLNICSGVGHSLGEVLDMMADIAGYSIDVHVNPAFVRSNEVARLVGFRWGLREAVGVLPTTPLRDTLIWMYASQ